MVDALIEEPAPSVRNVLVKKRYSTPIVARAATVLAKQRYSSNPIVRSMCHYCIVQKEVQQYPYRSTCHYCINHFFEAGPSRIIGAAHYALAERPRRILVR